MFQPALKKYKSSVRALKLDNISIGGQKALSFMHRENIDELSGLSSGFKPAIAVGVVSNIPDNFPDLLKKSWGESLNSSVAWAKKAVETGADALLIRFNIANCEDTDSEIAASIEKFEQIQDAVDVPLMVLGSGKDEIDNIMLPEMARKATRQIAVGEITEDNYKAIVPSLIEFNHCLTAKTPIDINLAKQLNILITEMGFDPDRIIIDPDVGALGYGLDYAYSVIERIRIAALEGDSMLNMPIITLVGEEAWKSKEAKSANVQPEFGDHYKRAIIWECMTASSILAAGADIVVLHHPESINYVRKFINKSFKNTGK